MQRMWKKCIKLINEALKTFSITYQFCNGDLHKFVSLVRKGVYSYEYMDSWEKFDETSLPDKKAFYSKLNLEDITDKDYDHAKRVWEVFKIKNLGAYHDLYVQCKTLLLQMCLEILEISVLKYIDLILLFFCLHQDWHGKLA